MMEEDQQGRLARFSHWFNYHRMFTFLIFMLIVWSSLLGFFYMKADEITKDPCSICAEKMCEDVVCTTQTFIPARKIYYSNGSIIEEITEVKQDYSDLFNLD